VARTREQQENIAKGLKPDGSARALPPGMSVIGFDYSGGPPTINFDEDDGDWSYTSGVTAGQDIAVSGPPDLNVDFTPEYSETFVLSGGMDSPTIYSEDEQPTGVAVHELTAQYDVGF